ncbi:hypothetical protein HDU76_003880 [Blyttiomyces sp. JEL0837]|nr:hypothetical protein HDU76_003880 [Blyttiomyces sp. JEL0837]
MILREDIKEARKAKDEVDRLLRCNLPDSVVTALHENHGDFSCMTKTLPSTTVCFFEIMNFHCSKKEVKSDEDRKAFLAGLICDVTLFNTVLEQVCDIVKRNGGEFIKSIGSSKALIVCGMQMFPPSDVSYHVNQCIYIAACIIKELQLKRVGGRILKVRCGIQTGPTTTAILKVAMAASRENFRPSVFTAGSEAGAGTNTLANGALLALIEDQVYSAKPAPNARELNQILSMTSLEHVEAEKQFSLPSRLWNECRERVAALVERLHDLTKPSPFFIMLNPITLQFRDYILENEFRNYQFRKIVGHEANNVALLFATYAVSTLIILTGVFSITFKVTTPTISDRNLSYLSLIFVVIGSALLIMCLMCRQYSRAKIEKSVTAINEKRRPLVTTGRELERSSRFLINTFNRRVSATLRENPQAGLMHYTENGAVLALDITGFTAFSSKMTSIHLVEMLNKIYLNFDHICQEQNLEKICTIGDAYIAVGGLPEHIENPSVAVCTAALKMQSTIASFKPQELISDDAPQKICVRIGIHSGPICCALIGGRIKIRYDVVGDAIDLATELEQTAIPGTVHICQGTLSTLMGHECRVTEMAVLPHTTYLLCSLDSLDDQI